MRNIKLIIKVIAITIIRVVSFRGKSTGCDFAVAHRDFTTENQLPKSKLTGGHIHAEGKEGCQ